MDTKQGVERIAKQIAAEFPGSYKTPDRCPDCDPELANDTTPLTAPCGNCGAPREIG